MHHIELQGARVWLPDANEEWVGAEIIKRSTSELVVKTFTDEQVRG
jgi:myosin heavy subunit